MRLVFYPHQGQIWLLDLESEDVSEKWEHFDPSSVFWGPFEGLDLGLRFKVRIRVRVQVGFGRVAMIAEGEDWRAPVGVLDPERG